ncbi:MAG TPA: type I 3-dehydroquinate dehydratase [Phycisphaerales bacterium]|nr:type I 3-dehydroquinate dehydratase [Phycisphaerales bacterium]
MSTLLCVPILVQDEPTALADALAAWDAGADLVEFRIDEIFSGTRDAAGHLDEHEVNTILRLVAGSRLPCIVTCRAAAEGGHYDGDDMARVALYERLGTASPTTDPTHAAAPKEHPPRYLDIEYAAYSRSANLQQKVHLAIDYPAQRRDTRPGLILSMHDHAGRPADLLRRIARMQAEPAASIVKVAITARSIRDNLELFDLLAENATGKPTIALAMDRFGLMSRVLAPKFGGFLTFATLRPQSTTAPGQPTVRELRDLYRTETITPRTRVYGLIGWPVEHSLSPLVHNAGFDALEPDDWTAAGPVPAAPAPPAKQGAPAHDGVYLPLPVPPEYEHFKATLSALIDHPRLDFSGCSVTIPHKQHLLRFARERIAEGDELEWTIDPLSKICGAANTLVVSRDPLGNARRCAVLNTDGPAAVEALAAGLAGPMLGKDVVLIGAGGVARAIAAALLAVGAEVTLCARRPEAARETVLQLKKAEALVAGASINAATLEEAFQTRQDAVVNCTPVGMAGGPAPKDSPVAIDLVRKSNPAAVVMDTVYAPLETPLLAQAALAGLKAVDGLDMFIRQAGMQFTAWTGAPAPLRLFERIARDELAERERRAGG